MNFIISDTFSTLFRNQKHPLVLFLFPLGRPMPTVIVFAVTVGIFICLKLNHPQLQFLHSPFSVG